MTIRAKNMNNFEIENILKKFHCNKARFYGVYPCDKLPKNELKYLPCSFVVNLSPSSESGSHWVGLYIDANKRGNYFDSYGMRPRNKNIVEFLRTQCKGYSWSKKEIQSVNSSTCGAYAICFIIFMTTNYGQTTIKFEDLFSNNSFTNDFCIQQTLQNLKQQKCIL